MNAQGGYCGNALQAAASGWHDEVVRLLLEVGADVNAQGGCYGNALYAASYHGQEVIVRLARRNRQEHMAYIDYLAERYL